MRNTNSSSSRARSTVQYSAMNASLARIALCLFSSTLFDRRYACSSLLCWSSTRGYFIKYVWRRKLFVTSAITTVSWHSRRLTRRLRWIPLPFITMQQYWLVPFVYVSRQIPCSSPCMPRVYRPIARDVTINHVTSCWPS